MPSSHQYNRLATLLHWLLALLIVFSLIVGKLMLAPALNSDPDKLNGL